MKDITMLNIHPEYLKSTGNDEINENIEVMEDLLKYMHMKI